MCLSQLSSSFDRVTFNQKSNWKTLVTANSSEIHNFFGVSMNGYSPGHGARCSILRRSRLMRTLTTATRKHDMQRRSSGKHVSRRTCHAPFQPNGSEHGKLPNGRNMPEREWILSVYNERKCDTTDRLDTATRPNPGGNRPKARDNGMVSKCPVKKTV